eukprot:6227123-Prymnesium_polylepis.2
MRLRVEPCLRGCDEAQRHGITRSAEQQRRQRIFREAITTAAAPGITAATMFHGRRRRRGGRRGRRAQQHGEREPQHGLREAGRRRRRCVS